MDDETPLRIKRTTKDTETANKKKHLFKVIDESSGDDKDKAKEELQNFNNLVGLKGKEVGQNDENVSKKSNSYVPHLDDFSDDEKLLDKQLTSLSKDNKYQLFDEETDEDIDQNNNTNDGGEWVNINDLPWDPSDWYIHNNYIDDEAKEDLVTSDHEEDVRSSSEVDDKDSFIDDESLGYDTSDSQDTDDDF